MIPTLNGYVTSNLSKAFLCHTTKHHVKNRSLLSCSASDKMRGKQRKEKEASYG